MRVTDLMDRDPPCASVPGNRADLLRQFVRLRLPGLPVVKEGSRKLAGVVLRTDLFRDPSETQIALLMNPNPFTMYAQAPMREAAALVVENRLPLLPVVSGANDLVGLLTPRSFLEVLLEQRGRVQPHLRGRVVPVHRKTPARVAMRILQITNAPALPVLDDDGRLVGIATDGNLLSGARVADATTRSVLGISGDEDEWTWEGLRDVRRLTHATSSLELPSGSIEGVMARNVATVTPLTTVADAAQLMAEGALGHIPVVDEGGTLIDLLTDLDLVRALL